MVATETLLRALPRTLEGVRADKIGLPSSWAFYEGKVRDNFMPGDGTRILVTSDRISAFDRVLTTLPFKGQVLNRLAAHWFEATKHLAKNHVIAVPDPNVLVGRDVRPLPVEMVVRAYLTGVTSTSIWTHYARGERVFCGHVLPDGLHKNEPLAAPILTPSTKAAKGGHDVSVSRAEILAEGKMTEDEFDRAAATALALFRFGVERAAARGLILVDTKYELGVDDAGEIVVIDEIHTPDSSRYWFQASYAGRLARGQEPESFDKEYVRRWLADAGFLGDGPIPPIPDEVRVEAARRYIEAYETLVGETFVPDEREPFGRIKENLGAYLAGRGDVGHGEAGRGDTSRQGSPA
jgi:phosphoribosylaminoimidazole-succinocarboxamide synthase